MGSEDQVVPLETLREFYDAVPSEDKSFSIIESADHFLFSSQNVDKTTEVVVGWLRPRIGQKILEMLLAV
jgi:esterase/lipase